MSVGVLEHVNLTVKDPQATAAMLVDLFGWHIRWQGEALHGGFTIHVGSDSQYLAVYSGPGGEAQVAANSSYTQLGGLNHVAIVVDDLPAARKRVVSAGFTPGEEQNYEPGHRFYFRDADNIEFEIVSYA